MEQNKLSAAGQSSRNYGIDLLRIVSMVMIPVLHILNHGGVLGGTELFSAKYALLKLLETVCICAVNCYALISGYVGYGSKFRYSNILYLCFQVFFYTFSITAVFAVISPGSVDFNAWKEAVFPFAYNVYWYFTSYFCMFFFIPFLNLVIEKCDRGKGRALIASILFVFSFLPTLFRLDIGRTVRGYSALWLALMYLIGAYMKKYDSFSQMKGSLKITIYAVCVVITWGAKVGLEALFQGSAEPSGADLVRYLSDYSSPSIVLCSVFLLLFFSKLKISKGASAGIRFFAPVSFGVYLIHEAPFIRSRLFTDAFTGYAGFHPVAAVLAVIGTAIAIWLLCSLADRVRLEIFKALKIKEFCRFIEKSASKLWGKAFSNAE